MLRSSERDRFFEVAPSSASFLDANDAGGVAGLLGGRGWLEPGEVLVSVETAGLGNMNYLLRVRTNHRTFILKQSRPWVDKYPDIAAPFDRALVEAEFYRLVAGTEVAEFMPKLHWVDEESRILCLEDLGTLGDCSNIYAGVPLSHDEQQQLCRFLSLLHSSRSRLANHAMRRLNHFHIFVFPFQVENNLDLDEFTPGLQQLADSMKRNHLLLSRVAELGQIYLSEGDYLLHGDYFPGSWLRAKPGLKIIDPEFGFGGPREFDIAVLSAHLRIASVPKAETTLASSYARWKELDHRLVQGLAGVEILRRLLGVAQLPIRLDLRQKESLVGEAVHKVLS